MDGATDSAEQVINKDNTNVRHTDRADTEMDVATNSVDHWSTWQAFNKDNEEDTATNFKSGTKTITIGQYLGK